MNVPVFDMHCDTALMLMGNDYCQKGNLRKNTYHFDLERAQKAGVGVQCFACMGTTLEMPWSHIKAEVFFERQLATIQREVDRNQDLIRLAYTAEDIRHNLSHNLISAVLTLEGAASFGFDHGLLEDLYAIGFRAVTLSWNESNPLTGSHITGEGLTQKGRDFVREAQKVGMMVDVSHISDKGFFDIAEIAEKPIIASHSNSRKVFGVSRNLSDDMFKLICQLGGVAGLNLYSEFIGIDPDLDDACRHLLHYLELDPTGTHIALGGDLDGCDKLCGGFNGVQDYPLLVERLIAHGTDLSIIENIFWNNALGVMERCCM